jgi:hypothetical protein
MESVKEYASSEMKNYCKDSLVYVLHQTVLLSRGQPLPSFHWDGHCSADSVYFQLSFTACSYSWLLNNMTEEQM